MVHGQLTWELFSGLRSYNAGRSSTYRVQAAEEAPVITSYSIHYTKLYEVER